VVPTSVRHVFLTVSAVKNCDREQTETHDAIRNVLIRGNGVDRERGNEKDKCHYGRLAARVGLGAVLSVVEGNMVAARAMEQMG